MSNTNLPNGITEEMVIEAKKRAQGGYSEGKNIISGESINNSGFSGPAPRIGKGLQKVTQPRVRPTADEPARESKKVTGPSPKVVYDRSVEAAKVKLAEYEAAEKKREDAAANHPDKLQARIAYLERQLKALDKKLTKLSEAG